MSETTHRQTPNVRAPRYFIVESKSRCPQCKNVTTVVAVALPNGYESYVEDDKSGAWEMPGSAAVLSYVEYLPETIAHRVSATSLNYRLDSEEESGCEIWLNHCEHCRAKLPEEELHGDPDAAFGAVPQEGFGVMRLQDMHEPFEAWAGCESHHVMPLDS
jgi:hypothetical protein